MSEPQTVSAPTIAQQRHRFFSFCAGRFPTPAALAGHRRDVFPPTPASPRLRTAFPFVLLIPQPCRWPVWWNLNGAGRKAWPRVPSRFPGVIGGRAVMVGTFPTSTHRPHRHGPERFPARVNDFGNELPECWFVLGLVSAQFPLPKNELIPPGSTTGGSPVPVCFGLMVCAVLRIHPEDHFFFYPGPSAVTGKSFYCLFISLLRATKFRRPTKDRRLCHPARLSAVHKSIPRHQPG